MPTPGRTPRKTTPGSIRHRRGRTDVGTPMKDLLLQLASRPVRQDPELEALRQEIDTLDQRILDLVAARVRVVLRVGELKRRVGLPVYDPDRERRMLERLEQASAPPLDRSTVRRIFERLIDESRRIEQNRFDR